MCAATVCALVHSAENRSSRFWGMGIFAILYLAFCIVFGIHLGHWDWNSPGKCYNPYLIAAANSAHPLGDKIYLGITCLYMYVALGICILGGASTESDESEDADESMDIPILFYAFLQYPLHLYNVFALRASNNHLLQGDSENSWGFGQIVALTMVGQTLVECCRAVHGMYLCKL
jgi:hypothetical protein